MAALCMHSFSKLRMWLGIGVWLCVVGFFRCIVMAWLCLCCRYKSRSVSVKSQSPSGAARPSRYTFPPSAPSAPSAASLAHGAHTPTTAYASTPAQLRELRRSHYKASVLPSKCSSYLELRRTRAHSARGMTMGQKISGKYAGSSRYIRYNNDI